MGSGHGHSHGHNKNHGTKKPSSSSSSKDSNSAKSGSNSDDLPSATFLFVVNEFQVNLEPPAGEARCLTDQWGNFMPPARAEAYQSETRGTVFRYKRGNVTPAPEFQWYRPAMGKAGSIIDGHGNLAWMHKQQTVFACSALLPIVVADCDASLGYSWMRRGCRHCDGFYDFGCYSRWDLLHFDHYNGITQATKGSIGSPYIAGSNASWMPALVPKVFKNNQAGPGAAPPRSRGLSGELPIVIALMAFHSSRGHASEVFRSQWWQGNRWHGPSKAPQGYPGVECSPRGFLVHIAVEMNYDLALPDLPEEDFARFILPINTLEKRGVLVEG
ncbi:hypothetical protein B0T17DRAFT_501591 [Bombardia bombarda]|uniref:Uncharacterized protein n=1 Tax=Bombardia bombarda TaxID=252184 RepID=A0AA39TQM8_9PEZI|nr:hypothetical protein B0T17DRAFT_501591 [Bombardia bombarda]